MVDKLHILLSSFTKNEIPFLWLTCFLRREQFFLSVRIVTVLSLVVLTGAVSSSPVGAGVGRANSMTLVAWCPSIPSQSIVDWVRRTRGGRNALAERRSLSRPTIGGSASISSEVAIVMMESCSDGWTTYEFLVKLVRVLL